MNETSCLHRFLLTGFVWQMIIVRCERHLALSVSFKEIAPLLQSLIPLSSKTVGLHCSFFNGSSADMTDTQQTDLQTDMQVTVILSVCVVWMQITICGVGKVQFTVPSSVYTQNYFCIIDIIYVAVFIFYSKSFTIFLPLTQTLTTQWLQATIKVVEVHFHTCTGRYCI